MVLADRLYDTTHVAKAAGLIAASTSHTILDLGDADVTFDVVLNVTAVEVASSDEVYEVHVLGSDSDTFASGIEILGTCQLGDTVGIGNGVDVDGGVGDYVFPCRNGCRAGRRYRYVRLRTEVRGTVATGVNFSAFLGLLHRGG